MRQDAYTLIELLAVVVILGLAASLGVPSLVRSVNGQSLDRVCRDLRDAEHRARHLALGRGMELELSTDGFACTQPDLPCAFRAAPGGSVIWSNTEGRSKKRLAINQRGRSEDLWVEVTLREQSRFFFVSGISGEWSVNIERTPTEKSLKP